MQRVLTYSGGGYAKPNLNALNLTGAGDLEIFLSQQLSAYGWGIQGLRVSYSYGTLSFTAYYNVTVEVLASNNENPERVKLGITNLLSEYLSNVTLQLTGDNTGQAQIVDDSILGNIQSSIFGSGNQDNTGAATVLGLSAGTAVVIGLSLIVFLALKSPSNPVNYIRSYARR